MIASQACEAGDSFCGEMVITEETRETFQVEHEPSHSLETVIGYKQGTRVCESEIAQTRTFLSDYVYQRVRADEAP